MPTTGARRADRLRGSKSRLRGREARAAFTLVELPAVSRRRRSAFTLVELLVVIAVILLLLTLLLPALKGAADYAKMHTCLNNLHQIAAATFAYAADHDGLLPFGIQAESWGWRWETCLIPYLGLARFTNGANTGSQEACLMILGYTDVPWWTPPRVITTPGPLACPQDNPNRNWAPEYFLLKSYSGNSGFYYDGALAYWGRAPLSLIPQPAATLLNTEHWGGFCGMNWGRFQCFWWKSYDNDLVGALYTPEGRQLLSDRYGIAIQPDFVDFINTTWLGQNHYDLSIPAGYPHHRGKMNMSLCDGSARSMFYQDSMYPLNLWSVSVGWKKTTLK